MDRAEFSKTVRELRAKAAAEQPIPFSEAVRPVVEFLRFVFWVSLALLAIAVGVYALVHFVKWAWFN